MSLGVNSHCAYECFQCGTSLSKYNTMADLLFQSYCYILCFAAAFIMYSVKFYTTLTTCRLWNLRCSVDVRKV